MIWFKSNSDEKITKLLKQASGSFNFDQDLIKSRLLHSIKHQKTKNEIHIRHWHLVRYASFAATIVIFLSATLTFASNSKPGDKLFAVNKVREKIILSLPLSVEQKAKVQTQIVTSRLAALDEIKLQRAKVNSNFNNKKLQTVKESNEALNSAVETISQNKRLLEGSGNRQGAKNLEILLNRLEKTAKEHEQTVHDLGEETDDEEVKAKIKNHLRQMTELRRKAHDEAHLEFDEKSGD